jgi:branched-chain amino acid transport system substrate-binding protein
VKHRLVTLVLAAAVIAALVIVGCAEPATPGTPTTPATPTGPEEIRIGTCASLTGMYAGFGEGGAFGNRAAVEDINKLGGIYIEEYGRKLPVKLIVVDDESSEINTGTLAEDLCLRDKVHGLAGHFGSPGLHAMVANVAEKHKIPYVVEHPLETWMALRQEVSPPWEYTWSPGFGISTPPEPGDIGYGQPGYTVVDVALELMNEYGDQTNRVAGVFASDEPAGKGFYVLFAKGLEDWGADVIGIDHNLGLFPLGTTDFTSIIEEWKDNDVEVLFGNCPGPLFGALWRQAYALEFQPKLVYASRGALFYEDIISYGGDLAQGIGTEVWWGTSYEGCPGFGDTTPQTLYERWHEETGRPINPNAGFGYASVQILIDAIERAGTLDSTKVNQALAETDMITIASRVKFNEKHFSRLPVFYGQWQKTAEGGWECVSIVSQHDFIPETGECLFPIPYD